MTSSVVFLISAGLWIPMVMLYVLLTRKGIESIFSPLGTIFLGIIGIVFVLIFASIVARLYEEDIGKSIIAFVIITMGFVILDIMGLYFYHLNNIIFS
ncbi:MAG: hypothetical protein ACO2ON_04185 [Candidatus Nanopusillus sp.]